MQMYMSCHAVIHHLWQQLLLCYQNLPINVRGLRKYIDSTVSTVFHENFTSSTVLDVPCWKYYSLPQYKQLWPQLYIIIGDLGEKYSLATKMAALIVPILSKSLPWKHSIIQTRWQNLNSKSLNTWSSDSDRRLSG